MTESNATSLCIIGLGPRGLSVAERLVANAAISDRPLTIHLVDPYVRIGGRVWRVDQSELLLMNTVASQVTMFTDDSVRCDGPIVSGPSLYEWAQLVLLMDPGGEYPAHVLAEAGRLGPDSYPTRAFYGHYLRWVLDRVVSTAPATVSVHRHARTAVRLDDAADGTQSVTFDDGTQLTGLQSVVLTLGHVDMPVSAAERQLRAFTDRHDLTYLRTGNPAEADLSRIRPGQAVALRGMGLNFFDYLTLLTVGRGGRFVSDGGRLTYQASGAEPRIFAGSRRGVPYHARGENQKGAFGRHMPIFLTPEVIHGFRHRREAGQPVEFVADVWPLVDREVRAVYYHALIAGRADQATADAFLAEFGAQRTPPPGADDELLDRYGVAESDWWDWNRIARPYGDRRFTDQTDYQDWLLAHLRHDVEQARLGNVTGPLKAALDVLRDLRNEVRLVVDHSGITGSSYRDELQRWYTPLNAFVSIGPPATRIEEMIALIEAGVLTVMGPGLEVGPAELGATDIGPADDGLADVGGADDGAGRSGAALVVRSTAIPGSELTVTALIEARLPDVDVRTTDDPLLSSMLLRGQCRAYEIPDSSDGSYRTGALAVTRRPCRLVDRTGRVHPNRYALSIPTEIVHWATAAGIRPGVDSVILGDADAIARACLAVDARGVPAQRQPSTPAPGRVLAGPRGGA
ncbi:FAD/NAD(P)-binding protein [Solwaraspora sp. WMMD406]|uniref:FAD/NAD(P)-binding protein n=1 Tax=Solwaraspora sp. WMMD406 TaxID=3016095 RepID=UPI0024174DD5|nr:FAD/NAD(P)-binding protein [Solwaraspora sp. WMMD406]MDG4765022.1 FAD/NAD(P)-binding protein [Solwaraspora sp. WMMD406]